MIVLLIIITIIWAVIILNSMYYDHKEKLWEAYSEIKKTEPKQEVKSKTKNNNSKKK